MKLYPACSSSAFDQHMQPGRRTRAVTSCTACPGPAGRVSPCAHGEWGPRGHIPSQGHPWSWPPLRGGAVVPAAVPHSSEMLHQQLCGLSSGSGRAGGFWRGCQKVSVHRQVRCAQTQQVPLDRTSSPYQPKQLLGPCSQESASPPHRNVGARWESPVSPWCTPKPKVWTRTCDTSSSVPRCHPRALGRAGGAEAEQPWLLGCADAPAASGPGGQLGTR